MDGALEDEEGKSGVLSLHVSPSDTSKVCHSLQSQPVPFRRGYELARRHVKIPEAWPMLSGVLPGGWQAALGLYPRARQVRAIARGVHHQGGEVPPNRAKVDARLALERWLQEIGTRTLPDGGTSAASSLYVV